MGTPRCGVKDNVGSNSTGRSKRYALQGDLFFNFYYTMMYVF